MATLSVQNAVISGTGDLTFAAAAGGGDDMPNDGRTRLVFNNASGGAITVTIVTPRTVAGLAVADASFVVGAGQIAVSGVFRTDVFNSNGSVSWTYSGVSSLTVAAFR